MDDAKALGKVLSKYKDTFYVQVLVAYFATYVLYPLCEKCTLFHANTLIAHGSIYWADANGKS